MRASAVCLALPVVLLNQLLLIPGFLPLAVVRAQEPESDLGDLEELEDDTEEASAEEAQASVEDFDLGMPEAEQNLRMSACFALTMNRVKANKEQVATMAKEIASQQETMTAEQAMNSILFSWMMTCYMNIETSEVDQVSSGSQLESATEDSIFSMREGKTQTAQTASKRQWKRLEGVISEHMDGQKENKKQQQQQQSSSGRRTEETRKGSGYDVPGAGMSGSTQALYILAVFGGIFGLGGLAVMRLSKSGEEGSSKKSAKADKKKKKA